MLLCQVCCRKSLLNHVIIRLWYFWSRVQHSLLYKLYCSCHIVWLIHIIFIFVVDLAMKKCIKMISDFLISFWYTFSCPSSPINARTEIHHRTQESPNRTTLVKVKNGLVHWALFKYWTDVKTSNKSPLEILVNELLLYELRFTINHSQLLFNSL